MAESGHEPARVVGGQRVAPARPHAHHDGEGTAQTTLVSALDSNANNSALVKDKPDILFEAAEKKKHEGKKDPKVPKHDKGYNNAPNMKKNHTIQQPGNHHQ